jgi:hypothetical protein
MGGTHEELHKFEDAARVEVQTNALPLSLPGSRPSSTSLPRKQHERGLVMLARSQEMVWARAAAAIRMFDCMSRESGEGETTGCLGRGESERRGSNIVPSGEG